MQIVKYPGAQTLKRLLKRPVADAVRIEKQVSLILKQVKLKGDEALRTYTLQFDKVDLKNFRVPEKEIKAAGTLLNPELKKAIRTAQANILKFHQAQQFVAPETETTPGVLCWQISRAIQDIGIYIPGGSAPLFSTVLMLAIPARIAGCKRIVLCSPPSSRGKIHPAILFAAGICNIKEIYKIGGAQAIGALAYGTKTIAPVDKIFGPGNRYVTTAKQWVQKEGIAIDMPAGPSELMIVADRSADPAFIAADLLSQVEHGPDSQVVLISLYEPLLKQVNNEIEKQLVSLDRKEIAGQALKSSRLIQVKTRQEAISIINRYAPEHLILALEKEDYILERVVNAGSIFIGNYTPESAGDYASGTNHTLPTNGYARAYSGLSLDSFAKKISCQKISAQGIQNLGQTIEVMAEAENLMAHKNAVSIRLKKLKN